MPAARVVLPPEVAWLALNVMTVRPATAINLKSPSTSGLQISPWTVGSCAVGAAPLSGVTDAVKAEDDAGLVAFRN